MNEKEFELKLKILSKKVSANDDMIGIISCRILRLEEKVDRLEHRLFEASEG